MRERIVKESADARQTEDRTATEAARASRGFAGIIGQGGAIRRLKELAALYSQTGRPPGHVLLTGVDGIGKRTIARAFAGEFGWKWVEADARTLARTGDIIPILTNLGESDVFLLRDVTKAPKPVVQFLLPTLKEFSFDFVVDKGMFAKTIHVPLKRFTCFATAASKSGCPADLIDAFLLVLSLQNYSQPELVSVCGELAHERGVSITPFAAAQVAAASAGTPRHIQVLVDQLAGLGRSAISDEDVTQVLSVLGLSAGRVGSAWPESADLLSGVEFEKVVGALLQRMGFNTEMTAVTGDGGIDIVATLDRPLIGGRYLIQCKRFAPDNLVGAATVRDFYGALTADRGAVKGILITTSGFTSQALDFARHLPLELVGGQQLRELIAKYGAASAGQGLLF